MVSSLDLVDKSRLIWSFLTSLYGKKPPLNENCSCMFTSKHILCIKTQSYVTNLKGHRNSFIFHACSHVGKY